MKTARAVGTFVLTMSAVVVVSVGLLTVWGISAGAVMIEDMKK